MSATSSAPRDLEPSTLGRAGEGQLGLLGAGDHVGLDAELGARPSRRTRRGSRRRGWRSWPPSGRARRRRRGSPRRSRRARPGCARALPAPSRPVRSTPCPSRTTRISRTTSVSAPSLDVGDQQPDRVRPAVDAGDAHHDAPRGTHGPSAHHAGSAASASSPSGFTPGPAASACPTSDVQALDPGRHAAGADPGDLGDLRRSPRAGRGRPRAPRGTPRPAPRPSRSRSVISRIIPLAPACRSRPRPAGRSGSRASGTACRRAAAARSRRRRDCRTGSGARPRGSPAAARPSWAPTTARSAASTGSVTSPRRGRCPTAALFHAPSPSVAAAGPGGLLDVGPLALVDHDVHGVAGHRELQSVAGLPLHVARDRPALLLPRSSASCVLVLLQLLRGGADVAAAAEVAVDRRGQQHDEQRRPARPSTSARPVSTGPRRGCSSGAVRRRLTWPPAEPGRARTAGTRRRRRSGRRRRARPRCAAAGCTSRPARCGPARRS